MLSFIHNLLTHFHSCSSSPAPLPLTHSSPFSPGAPHFNTLVHLLVHAQDFHSLQTACENLQISLDDPQSLWFKAHPQDSFWHTPFLTLVKYNPHSEVTLPLLERQSPELLSRPLTPQGFTLPMACARHNRPELLEQCLLQGYCRNQMDDWHYSVLHYMVEHQALSCMDHVLSQWDEWDWSPQQWGLDPFAMWIELGDQSLVELPSFNPQSHDPARQALALRARTLFQSWSDHVASLLTPSEWASFSTQCLQRARLNAKLKLRGELSWMVSYWTARSQQAQWTSAFQDIPVIEMDSISSTKRL